MEISTIVEYISSIGFPSAVSVILLWALYKEQQNFLSVNEKFQAIVSENTKTIAELKTVLFGLLSQGGGADESSQ